MSDGFEIYRAFGPLGDPQVSKAFTIDIPGRGVVDSPSAVFCNLGSCFAAHVEDVFRLYGVNSYFRTETCKHFSAESMLQVLDRLAEGRRGLADDELYAYEDELGGLRPTGYHFLDRFHGGRAALEARLAWLDDQLLANIRKCTHMIVTLGIANVVRLKATGRCVNRVAGMPAGLYEVTRHSVDEELGHLQALVERVRGLRGGSCPAMFFTISPQRYMFHPQFDFDTRDDSCMARFTDSPYVENCVSKATLRVAVDMLLKANPGLPLYYFPAYEIVIDELRAQESFTGKDAASVTWPLTPRYVAKRFLQSYFSPECLRQITLLDRLHVFAASTRQLRESKPGYVLGSLRRDFVDGLGELGATWRDYNAAYVRHLHAMAVDLGCEETALRAARAFFRGARTVAVWGVSGYYAKYVSPLVRSLGGEVRFVLADADPAKAGSVVDGLAVREPSALREEAPEILVVASSSREDIVEQADALGLCARIF
ncbi:GSCFA domain-containing protein [Fundidesulfovibrio soli]|uniref:GSCFA domain-containing protein n=1 Tax=Fundidesulfovibrio soli TaxID=2922716 RepID=UPI001FAF3989|nr:GSCFA domain-containing protein [Fundidesulfovibrio soli]